MQRQGGNGGNYRMIQLTCNVTIPDFEIKDRKKPFDEYIDWYRLKNLKEPNDFNRFCYAKALFYDHQFDKALYVLDQCDLQQPVAQFLRGYVLLQLGDLANGLRLREARFQAAMYPLHQAAPQWDGQQTDKKLFIWQEGGFGDVIQYMRYLPKVLELCPNATVLVDTNIQSFIDYNFPQEVMSRFNPHDFQLQCSFMSLPYLLGDFTIDKRPYLKLPPNTTDWGHYEGLIGFNALGNPAHSSDKLRSLRIEDYAKFWGEHNLCDVSPTTTAVKDWLDTAQLISKLKLLITVDTGMAHLAGALGVPVWVMMNKHHDWRWSHEWYDSMRIFRCVRHSEWGLVIAQIEEELRHGRAHGDESKSAISVGVCNYR